MLACPGGIGRNVLYSRETNMHFLLSSVRWLRQAVLPALILLFVGVTGFFFYLRAESSMASQLRDRLESAAAVAAAQFTIADIRAVRGSADEGSAEHRRLVTHLQRTRAMIPGVRFAYIVRATDAPGSVEFVADADEFLPLERLDLNGDGGLDRDEAPARPGERYDISSMPEFQAGFVGPSADRRVTYDPWGALISGYAPIRGERGETVAVLGLDMSADDFLATSRSIFSPLALLSVLFGGVLLALFTYSVSQRRRLVALRQMESERSALLDLAAHQLGMPLATFRWWIELLRERRGSDDTEDNEGFDQLQLGVDRMDHIVRSLQEASNLQAGSVDYAAVTFDALPFVQGVVESMKPALDLKKQTIEIAGGEGLPAIAADRKLLSGVLAELIENARGYSPVGSHITVRISRARSFVKIAVEDHGCGIPANEIPRMFHKFTRGKKAHLSKPSGNGLGLYICKGIVERAGGTIAVASKEGQGTTVSISLPVAR